MFKKLLTIGCVLGMLSTLAACATGPVAPGPYNGLVSTDSGAKSKIGCFKYTDDVQNGPVLTPQEARICEQQAVKCQHQQNNMASSFGETVLANGGVSAGVGSGQEGQEVKMLGATKAVVGKYAGIGAVLGALGSVNGSMLVYSQASDSTVGSCSRDFLARYKRLHPGNDDLFIETELVRTSIQGNVVRGPQQDPRR